MDGRVGRLHNHYRVLSGSDEGSMLCTRMDKIASDQLPAAFAERLNAAMGGDESVYMLRRLEIPIFLCVKTQWNDAVLARQWAAQLTLAAVCELAKGSDSVNSIYFENQAELVARFIVDLSLGEAWNRWFYNCFASLRTLTVSDAIVTVLLEYRDLAPAVLAKLHVMGGIDRLIKVLDRSALRQIWICGLEYSADALDAQIRPLFAAALRLAGDEIALPRSLAQRWFEEYLQTLPSPPDWRDRAGLSLGVVAAFTFLWKRGYVQESLTSLADLARIQNLNAAADFDWLDNELLSAELYELVKVQEPGKTVPDERAAINPPNLTTDLPLVVGEGHPVVISSVEPTNEETQHPDRTVLLPAKLAALQFLSETGDPRASITPLITALESVGQSFSRSGRLNCELLVAAVDTLISRSKLTIRTGSESLPPTVANDVCNQELASSFELMSNGPAQSELWTDAPASACELYAKLLLSNTDWAGNTPAGQAIKRLLAAIFIVNAELGLEAEVSVKDAAALLADMLSRIAHSIAADVNKGSILAPVFEHLDMPQLARALDELVAFYRATSLQSMLRPPGLTPRRRQLIADVSEAAAAERSSLNLRRADAPADALRLYSRLVFNKPDWAGDPLAAQAIQGLLAAAELVNPDLGMDAAHTALDGPGPVAEVARRFAQTFGDPGLHLALALAAASGSVSRDKEDRSGIFASGTTQDTDCAGIFLLLRAMLDARLSAATEEAGYPLEPTILALGLCWGGERAVRQGRIDEAVAVLAGRPPLNKLYELGFIWREVNPASHLLFQNRMLAVLSARALAGGPGLELHRIKLNDGHVALVAGGSDSAVWPLVRIVAQDGDEWAAQDSISEVWRNVTGDPGTISLAAESSSDLLRAALEAVMLNRLADSLNDLLAAWTLALASISLLRMWAAWLPQFSTSSTPYLLSNFIRRSGQIERVQTGISVTLAPFPLDIVIEMAGYLSEVHARSKPWECQVQFRMQR